MPEIKDTHLSQKYNYLIYIKVYSGCLILWLALFSEACAVAVGIVTKALALQVLIIGTLDVFVFVKVFQTVELVIAKLFVGRQVLVLGIFILPEVQIAALVL